jgi:hypothetical protein
VKRRLHPGPDISLSAAASLAARTPDRARALLLQLTRAHLLTEHKPGRYGVHDLLRTYAIEQAGVHDGPAARDAAVRRLVDYYLYGAGGAAMLIEPHLARLELAPARPGAVITRLTSAEDR